MVLVTSCFIRQLPQVRVLIESFQKHTESTDSVVIGLVDDAGQVPADFELAFPVISLKELYTPAEVAQLSAKYTPTELAAATKPRLIREAFKRFPDHRQFVYADPNVYFFDTLTRIDAYPTDTLLLCPHWLAPPTQSPVAAFWPDEKALQNVGLYQADLLIFRRSEATDTLLEWWQNRVETRAFINYCEGLCLDQIWLMHTPVFFEGVRIVKEPLWHLSLCNMPYNQLVRQENEWYDPNQHRLFTANFKGLLYRDEGLFALQNRLNLSARSDLTQLVQDYRRSVTAVEKANIITIRPAYGQKPESPVLRGWKQATVHTARRITSWLDSIDLPALPLKRF